MMNNKKTQIKFFTIPQYRQEEEYLSEMHEKGWKLTKVSFLGLYHFEKCEPAKVSYRLDYNKEGVENKAEYVQMFSDCGWEYMFDYVGYSYFRKEADPEGEREEIFCDDESRLDMMKRVFLGRIRPLIIIFLFIILPQLYMNTMGYGGGSIDQEVFSITFLGLAVLYIALFASMAFQYYKFEKRVVHNSSGVNYKYAGVFLVIMLFVVSVGAIFYFSNKSVFTIDEQGVNGCDGFVIEARRLNTEVERQYELKKGDLITVKHEKDGGEIFINIAEEGKEPVFFGNGPDLGSFYVEIQEDGCYIIKCSGDKMRGYVTFNIERVN